MKTKHSHPVSDAVSAALRRARARLNGAKTILCACTALAAVAAHGQTTRTWTGPGLDLGAAANWGGTLPNTANGDTALWDNLTSSNLFLTYNGNLASGFGQSGISFAMSANQTNAVNISSPVSSSVNLAVFNLTNNSPNAGFSLGNTTASVLNIIWRPGNANQLHQFVNNSPVPSIIHPNVRFQSGGGVTHVLLFDGTGDWWITNNIICANNAGTLIQKTGAGTLVWGGPSLSSALGNSTINSPITIAGGTVVLRHNTVLSASGVGTSGSQNIVNNGTLFRYDAPSLAQTLTGVISGSGNLGVANGTLTLSGANTYVGSTLLTGGNLIVNATENVGISGPLGNGGLISFGGGVLQFSANNTFDYSSRFDTAAGQNYKIDTGGQDVTLATDLASSGATLTKSGSGTLNVAGVSSYSGLTTVSGGRLVFQGVKSGTGNITVADGATLGVTANGTQVTPSVLTVGSSSGATLAFNSVNSTTTAIMAAGTLSTAGTITVNVNSGTFAVGQSYPLFAWTTGTAPAVSLGVLNGAVGNLSTNGNSIRLNITGLASVWSGAVSGDWSITGPNNWVVAGSPAGWVNGGAALFDDTATGETNVVLTSAVAPARVTVNSSSKTYSITSGGANVIGGSSTFTKSGASTLTLAGGVNTYSGATTISGGSVKVGVLANGGAASDIGSSSSAASSLVLDGGSLEYTGAAASIDRLFSLTSGGGALISSGSGALSLANSGTLGLSGVGSRVLTLAGLSEENNQVAAAIGDNGGATALTKSGAGKWILAGNNTYSGATTIANGVLQVGSGGATGSLGSGAVVNNGRLVFNRTGILTNTGAISGTGSLTNAGTGTVILAANNAYSGGTTIEAGTLQIGNGGSSGTLNAASPIINNGTLVYNSTASFTLAGGGVISGTGNLIVRGTGGLFKAIAANSYTGWTLIEPGATFQPCEGNQGALASSAVTNNGTLKLVRQDLNTFVYAGPISGTGAIWKDVNNVNANDVTLTGTNTYTGGTIIAGGGIILGDGITPGAGSIVGDVFFTNSLTPNDVSRNLTFNRPDDVLFPGTISYSTNLPFGNRGILIQAGPGKLTITGNNDYPGGTIISNTAGPLYVGNGGTSGAIGTGAVIVDGVIVFNRSDDLTFGGAFSGAGSVVKMGAGTLTLTGTNNYFGTTTVSNGALFLNNDNFASATSVAGGTLGGTGLFYGPITLDAGTTFSPGPSANAIGTFTAISDLTIGGNIAVQVNKSLAQSNDVVAVTGTLSKVGSGTLTVANLGPTLSVGDKFTIFSQPLANGAAVTVSGGSATWVNNLAVDGSITVATVTAPPTLNVTPSGNNLQFSWSGSGYKLQAQTNSLSIGLSNNWGDYPGGGSSPVSVPVNPANGAVFFRLVSTP